MIGALGTSSPWIVFIVAGAAFVALGVVFLWIARPPRTPEPARAAAAEPVYEATGPVIVVARTVTWPQLIDPDAGALDVAERRGIIEGFALVGDAWCAQILAKAYGDETDELREAVIDALGRCSGDVVPTLERALRSPRVAERYAAVDAASRRGDIALLERGIRDADTTVALAAAYGLVRAKRGDLVDAALAGRDDARANEVRRILAVLT
ncbi:MAG: HEAT repeat domain-containing protein [Candidatus Velthaea sp.]